jgi:hypothetical protein
MELQAYLLQLETEWLRSEPQIAGVLAFCYLANNYGYTGDWFTGNIRDLIPSPTLNWFSDCFSPSAVFINLTDERYVKQTVPHNPGEKFSINLAKINDLSKEVSGKVSLNILDGNGKIVSKKNMSVKLSPFDRSSMPAEISLPSKPGGYLLEAVFTIDGIAKPVISRRYIKIGKQDSYKYFELQPAELNLKLTDK